MGRTYFARGSKGMIAKRIQGDLFQKGFTTLPKDRFVDGDFGGNTSAAVKALQRTALLPETGEVDLVAFDVHVQNGRFKPSVMAKAAQWPANFPEPNRRRDLANWVADASTNVRFREDVRARKMCIARGGGPVRGLNVNLPSWGLAQVVAA